MRVSHGVQNAKNYAACISTGFKQNSIDYLPMHIAIEELEVAMKKF